MSHLKIYTISKDIATLYKDEFLIIYYQGFYNKTVNQKQRQKKNFMLR